LNALPAFSGINPSIEHFARILCEGFTSRLKKRQISTVEVKVWENRIAWASYMTEL
jgi:6-pyruvoyltetrahydropterin/6-carboxytetrahydropterin synthase